jgi:hypothetical protein
MGGAGVVLDGGHEGLTPSFDHVAALASQGLDGAPSIHEPASYELRASQMHPGTHRRGADRNAFWTGPNYGRGHATLLRREELG